jgi:ABC-type transport system substrate-binding protein
MLRFGFRPTIFLAILVMAVAVIAVACGGDDDAPASTATTAAPAATAPPAPTATSAGPQPTATRATGAFRATPTPAGAGVTPTAEPEPTAPPAMMEAEPKVETLVISVDPSAGETNLPWAGTVDHHQQMDLVMEVLVDIDPTTNVWVPELAKSWELSDDGTEWTFVLEEDVQFHNGWGEFTADDVFHTVAMYQRDDAILAYSTDWKQIDLDASTKVSDHEIILKLKNPNPDYLFYIAPSGGGLMTSKAQYDSGGDTAGGDAAYEEDMIGTGPYRYTGREFGVNVTYERLGDHWRRNNPPPSFEKVDLRWIREVASRNAGLLADEIHLTELTRDLADAAVADHGFKVIQSNFPGNQLNGIFQGLHPAEVGNFDPPFQDTSLPYTDVKVREAINRAIDKETIKNTLFSGRVSTSPQIGFYDSLPGWDPRWLEEYEEHYGYDPDRARELLAEAGYPDGFKVKGILMNVFGFPESADFMQALDVYFRDVGIEMELEEWEFSNYFSSWTNKEPEAFGIWISPPSFKTVYAQLSLFNRSSGAIHFYETPKLDELFAELSTTVGLDGRDRIQREMGNILYDEYAYMPFYYIFIEFVANPNIIDNWEFPGSDGANYGHFDLITACLTEDPCYD